MEESGSPDNLITRVIDVSAIGLCIVSTAALREGTALKVEISLPGAPAKHLVRALVRWSQALDANGERAHVSGLEFESVIEALAGRGGDSALLDIFLTLRVAVAQLRLYPKDSPQVLKVVTDTYHSIHSFLEHAGSLTLSKTPKGLLVNGRRLGGVGTVAESLEIGMLALLTDSSVKSFTFKKGITLEELITFLHALTKKFWDVKDGKEINRRLRDERVFQVTVDEVQYVALGAGDIVIEGAAAKFSGGDTELGKLLGNLDQMLDSAAGEGSGQEIRLQLIKKLLEKDPELLKHAGVDGAAPAAPDAQQGRWTFERAKESLGDVVQLLRDAPPNCQTALRRLGQAIIDAFKHDPQLASVMHSILAGALAAQPEVAATADAAKVPPAVARARTLLDVSDDDRIQAISQEGAALMDELHALGHQEIVQAIVASMAGMLLDRTARRRGSAARALNGVRRGLERTASDETLEELEEGVRTGVDLERDPGVYATLADLIAFLADLRIRRGRVDRARQNLEFLNRHYLIRDPDFPTRGELAYAALERVASGVGFASIAERLRTGDPEVLKVLEALDAAATRFLIREIKTADTPARRLHFAQFIARAGAGAATVLVDELQKTSSPSEVLYLVEVLPHALPREMAELALGGLLRHGAVAVRRRAAAALAEQSFGRSGQLIEGALAAESDGATRVAFVEALGRLRHRGAVEALSALVEDRSAPEDLRCAACMTLGRIGDVRAVSVLARIYSKGEKGITRMFRLVPPAVRGSAARALAYFPSNAEAREAMRRAREDHDPSVRSVANQALYAPLQEAFGEMALGVTMIASPDDMTQTSINAGGSAQEMPLDAVLARLGALEGSGLLLYAAAGAVGRVWFDAGLVIAAEFNQARDIDAVRELVGRRDGLFLFRAGELSPERRILMTVDTLLRAIRVRDPGSRPGPPTR
ncbi:MAG TPA: HEAT repeat domain-containing protein [Planctomycetota bacterium]